MSHTPSSRLQTRSTSSARTQLIAQPIRTQPNVTHYEWAGHTLRTLFRASRPIAETWAFFSGPSKPAHLAAPNQHWTMEDVVAHTPEVLGPAGIDPRNHRQKYFFVKFLDPSDFPPFAYVGFVPERLHALRKTPARFKAYFAELLWSDRQSLEALAELIRPRLRSRMAFERFKATYKAWAITQARGNWSSATLPNLEPFVRRADRSQARQIMRRQRDVRRRIVSLMHRIDFEDGQAILIETPTLHAIAGLSLQIHPRTKENFFPKDELWMYKKVPLPGRTRGWVLVEPQRTFDKTESGADFFTPFAWDDGRRSLSFRKVISQTYLRTFVELMDARAYPRAHYIRRAILVRPPNGTITGRAQWCRLVDEWAWPYFVVHELRFSGIGSCTTALSHASYTELHATRGAIDVRLSRLRGRPLRCLVTPTRPVLLPATLPYDRITYRATQPACLHVFTRRAAR